MNFAINSFQAYAPKFGNEKSPALINNRHNAFTVQGMDFYFYKGLNSKDKPIKESKIPKGLRRKVQEWALSRHKAKNDDRYSFDIFIKKKKKKKQEFVPNSLTYDDPGGVWTKTFSTAAYGTPPSVKVGKPVRQFDYMVSANLKKENGDEHAINSRPKYDGSAIEVIEQLDYAKHKVKEAKFKKKKKTDKS